MSKIESLKKQFPHLNITLLDFAKYLDSTNSHKYTPAICKILLQVFDLKESSGNDLTLSESRKIHIEETLIKKGFNLTNLSINQKLTLYRFCEFFEDSIFDTISDMIFYGERNLLETKDILTYKSAQEIKRDIGLATLKMSEKELSSQIHKEFENEEWIVVRPLTFEASMKYGASTKWCTTYRREKSYFAKYWDNGVLAYFINKKTGYKFAGFKGLKTSEELSFWSADDNRMDSLEIECDSYLYGIIKSVFKSTMSNSDLCDSKMRLEVANSCDYILIELGKNGNTRMLEPVEQINVAISDYVNFINTEQVDVSYNYNVVTTRV